MKREDSSPAVYGRWAVLLFVVGISAGMHRPIPGLPVVVERVVDGDTFIVRGNDLLETVRLIGVDTPERARGDRQEEYLARQAHEFAQARLEGRRAWIEPDSQREDRDDYGRSLRHVRTADGSSIGEQLLRRGLARNLARFRHEHSRRFGRLEREARARKVGLWEDDGHAELRWLAARGRRSVEVFAMSGGRWGLCTGDGVRTDLQSGELLRELHRLGRHNPIDEPGHGDDSRRPNCLDVLGDAGRAVAPAR